MKRACLAVLGWLVLLPCVIREGRADFEFSNFSQWTPVADPPDPNFSSSATDSTAVLSAGNGGIASGVDIGFQSANGATASNSTSGFKFDPGADFSLAITYSLSFSGSPAGLLGIGFGIGEDSDGMNSAGAAVATFNGAPALFFSGAARVNDQDQLLDLSPLTAATSEGTLFVGYEAASGNVTIGASSMVDADSPQASGVFSGIQDQWSDGDLMASFFLRSQTTAGLPAWQGGGTADAVFSNFRVLNGTAIVVPEPGSISMFCLISCGLVWSRRKRS
jgi:hypothetical protein